MVSNMETNKRYKKGHFIEMGMAIGIPLGIPVLHYQS